MMPKELNSGEIQPILDVPESISAPVKKGDEVGTVTYMYKGEAIAKLPVVAAESVDRSEVIQTIEQGKEIIRSSWFIVTAVVIVLLTAAYIVLMITMNRKRRKMRRIRKYRDL